MKKTNSLDMAVFCHYCGTVLEYSSKVSGVMWVAWLYRIALSLRGASGMVYSNMGVGISVPSAG